MKLIFMEDLEIFQYDKDGQVIEAELSSILNHENLCKYVQCGKIEKTIISYSILLQNMLQERIWIFA